MSVYHPRISAGLWLLGMVLIGIVGMQTLSRDWLETGFLALLPKTEQNPDVAAAIERQNQQVNRKVIWLTGASASADAIAAARRLERQVRQSGLFSEVLLEMPQEQAVKQYR